jgi:hypothetical protein
MKNEAKLQSVKIQIPQEEHIEMDIPIPSYYALQDNGKIFLSLKVCDEKNLIYASGDSITMSPVSNLYIFLKEPAYKPCEPEIFYKHLADVTAKINAIAGVEYLPLVHELSDEDYAQIKYDEGCELINEDRRERDESRKDDICHDPNY